MRVKDKKVFQRWAIFGGVSAIILVSTFYSIFPFTNPTPEGKTIAAIFVIGVAIVGFVTLSFYVFTQSMVFGNKVDGFMSAAGLVTIFIKLIATGELT